MVVVNSVPDSLVQALLDRTRTVIIRGEMHFEDSKTVTIVRDQQRDQVANICRLLTVNIA